jgi:hypothetical protein
VLAAAYRFMNIRTSLMELLNPISEVAIAQIFSNTQFRLLENFPSVQRPAADSQIGVTKILASIQSFKQGVVNEVNANLNEFNQSLWSIQQEVQPRKQKSIARKKTDEVSSLIILEEKLAEIQSDIKLNTLDRVAELGLSN